MAKGVTKIHTSYFVAKHTELFVIRKMASENVYQVRMNVWSQQIKSPVILDAHIAQHTPNLPCNYTSRIDVGPTADQQELSLQRNCYRFYT